MADNSNDNFFEGFAQDGQEAANNSGTGADNEPTQGEGLSGEAMLEDSVSSLILAAAK